MAERGPQGVTNDELPFRQLAQSLPTPCWISDPAGQIIWVNDAWLDYTGFDVGAIERQGLAPLHDRAVLPRVNARWDEVRRAGGAAEMVFPLRGRDGQLRPFITRVAPLRDSAGRLTGWFGTNTDISVQADAETRARQREEDLREVFDCAGDAIAITDGQGRILRANPAAAALLGYTTEELLETAVLDLVRVEDIDRLHVDRGRSETLDEWRLRRKDGALVDVEINTRQLSGGRRLAILREISERRRQEARREDASERQFRLLVANVVDYALYMLDRQGHVVSWNTGAQNIKGYAADEIVGRHFSAFYTQEDRAAGTPQRALATALEKGRFEAEGWRVRKDGSRFWASVVIDPIRDETGEHLGFAKITRDITERRNTQLDLQRAHDRLAQAQKLEAVGQLTGGVAHDFNNLLMVVGGQAQLLRDRAASDPVMLRRLDSIDAAARRGQDLTRHLLAFARRQRLQPAPLRLDERQAGLRELILASVGSMIRVNLDLPEHVWPVQVDSGELELALLNMAVNARDAMPQGGALSISAGNAASDEVQGLELTGDFVVLTIADTGQGIPPDILPKVFEPFFTTKPVNRGTGLGLSQVYGFAQQSGGRVTVDSTLGEGTRIRLFLPRATDEPCSAAAEPLATAPAGLDILVVEDNPDVAEVAAGLLAQLGHTPWLVNSADEAMGWLTENPLPDLVFSDIVMAGEMDGLGLAERLRVLHPQLPVLLASGYSDAAARSDAAFTILPKPYQIEDLARAVAAVAAGRRTAENA
ncbi:PAS domain S-box protein [Caulobacter sp. KR2-114]|uniref:PAS domain S-box protein n=1 Tax=Caulobacter sp. KR2-114 TaxID=3400912 RepID=UPI003BFF8AD7